MKYELMTIYKADLGESKAKDLSKKISELITSLNGSVLENNYWGRRKFAYEIKHNTEGFYDVFVFDIESSNVNQLKTKLNLESGLVRYLVSASTEAREEK
ncbi:30S ribosomal protein S6 [Patescibacteria group bacterium]